MGKFQDYTNKAVIDGDEKLLIADTNDATPNKTKNIIISAIKDWLDIQGLNADSIRGKEVTSSPVVADKQFLKFDSGFDKYLFDTFERASEAETRIGTDNIKLITPLRLMQVLGFEFLSINQFVTPLAQIVFTDLDDTYNHEFCFENIISQNDDTALLFQISFDNGSTWENTNYKYVFRGWDDVGGNKTDASVSATFGLLSNLSAGWKVGNAVGEFYNGKLDFSALTKTFSIGACYFDNATHLIRGTSSSFNGNVGIINAIRFYFQSGNIQSGNVTHYRYRYKV